MRLSKLCSLCGRGRNEAIYYGLKTEEKKKEVMKMCFALFGCCVHLWANVIPVSGRGHKSAKRAIDFNLLLTGF